MSEYFNLWRLLSISYSILTQLLCCGLFRLQVIALFLLPPNSYRVCCYMLEPKRNLLKLSSHTTTAVSSHSQMGSLHCKYMSFYLRVVKPSKWHIERLKQSSSLSERINSQRWLFQITGLVASEKSFFTLDKQKTSMPRILVLVNLYENGCNICQ